MWVDWANVIHISGGQSEKNQDGDLVPGDFDEMHAMYFHTEKELVKPVLGTINVWVQQFLFIAKMF